MVGGVVRLFPLSLLVSAITTSALSAALWAVTITGAWPAGVLADARAGGVGTMVVASLFWRAVGGRRRADADHDRLVEQMHWEGDQVYARIIRELSERAAVAERRHLRPVADSGPLPRA